MRKYKKPIYIFSGIYMIFAFVFFAANNFDLEKEVSRGNSNFECINSDSAVLTRGDGLSTCPQTNDWKWGYNYTWVSWQFFSNNQGNDSVRYIPADIFLLTLLSGSIYIFTRKN